MDDVEEMQWPEWHELSKILGAYLTQDWPDEYGDNVWDAVRDFRSSSPQSTVLAAADQVAELLARARNERELESALDSTQLDYYPPGDGSTIREWFVELEKFLRAATTTPESG